LLEANRRKFGEEVNSPIGMSRAEYRTAGALLDIAPIADPWCPQKRADDLPSWAVPPLFTTPHARERVKSWVAAGRPLLSADDVRLRLRCWADRATRATIHEAFATMAPPAAAHVLRTCRLLEPTLNGS